MDLKIPSFPQTDYSGIIEEANRRNAELNKALDEAAEEREKRYNDGVEREKRMIELLESIDKNTSVLSDMLKLLEENTQDQKAILEIINDFNSLATINEPETDQTLYRKIINKISTALSDVDTITTLSNYGLLVFNTLRAMGKI